MKTVAPPFRRLHVPTEGRRPAGAVAMEPAQELQLLLPAADVASPEFTLVIPARNEEKTIGEFVEWCKQGLAEAGVVGEILIVVDQEDPSLPRHISDIRRPSLRAALRQPSPCALSSLSICVSARG